jgi:hypothetical protein
MKEHEICWTWRTHGSEDIRGREKGGTGSTHGTDKMKEHEMGEACSTHEREEIMNCEMVMHVGESKHPCQISV